MTDPEAENYILQNDLSDDIADKIMDYKPMRL